MTQIVSTINDLPRTGRTTSNDHFVMSKLTLYGVPLSQPFRSVAWTLLQKRVRFQVQLVVPGSPHKKTGSTGEDFRALTGGRTTQVPVLRDDDDNNNEDSSSSFVVHESPAILTYLCQKYGWADLYPAHDLRQKTSVDMYLHWHHEGTRCLSRLIQPALRPDLSSHPHHPTRDELHEQSRAMLGRLDGAWLSRDGYLASTSHPTIADILCYGEVSQVAMLGAASLDGYPNLAAWTARMKEVEFHDEVHVALTNLGDVVAESDVPMMKRLGGATKAGLQALAAAQAQYAQ
jgi:glutathione S-transferase